MHHTPKEIGVETKTALNGAVYESYPITEPSQYYCDNPSCTEHRQMYSFEEVLARVNAEKQANKNRHEESLREEGRQEAKRKGRPLMAFLVFGIAGAAIWIIFFAR